MNLVNQEILNQVRNQDYASIDKTIEDELQEAVEFARISPFPEPEEALDDVYTI